MKKDDNILKMRLDNGLELVIEENHSVPVVGLNVWVKTGSADEIKGEEGLAHVHEHMLFKGTEKRATGEIAKEVEAMGGDINAFTSMDFTVYYIVVASRYFEQALDILADALQNSSFDEKELEKELKVILEELERGEDNPRHRIYEYFFDLTYKEHPYKRPIIGYRESIAGFQRQDVVAFFRKWYRPQNMVVSVCGDIDAMEAAGLIKKKFSVHDRTENIISPRDITEPAQNETRVKLMREDVMEGYMYLGFHIPEFGHEDMAALDVLSVVLGTGESSRLVEKVRSEKRLVSGIWAYCFTPRNPGMIMVGSNFMAEKLEPALEETLREIYNLKEIEIPDWELERAKRHVESDSIYSRETVQGEARRMGFLVAATGDPFYEEAYLEKVRNLKPSDIKSAAKKYLNPSSLSVTAIVPKDADAALTEESLRKAVQAAAEKSDAEEAAKEPEEMDLPRPARVKPGSSYSPPVKFELDNGIRLIVRENHTVPLVSTRAVFLGGTRVETPDTNGLCNLMAEVMTEGTESYSSETIHRSIESMAGSIAGFAGQNSFGVTMDVLSQYYEQAFDIFSEVLSTPSFPADQVEKARMIILSQIRAQNDQPFKLALMQYKSLLYPSHPYGMDPLGSEKTVKKFSRDDVAALYEKYGRPSNLVIAVAGDVDARAAKNIVEEKLGKWQAQNPEFPEIHPETKPQEIRTGNIIKDTGQANIILGFQGASMYSEDRYALETMTGVLSGMGGRLFLRLRDKRSLAYSVYAHNIDGIEPGLFFIYIGTSPEKQETAVKGILDILTEIMEEPVSDEELEKAKNMLIGDFEIQLQRNSAWATRMAFDEIYGLGFDNYQEYTEIIKAQTKETIMNAAKNYINPNSYVLSITGPENTRN